MDIVKALNLNNTPKDIKNGSIVCAKNIMTDDTASYLTQDIDIEEVENFNGGIVGIIPCSSEIVVLTGDSKIYRIKDNSTSPVEEVMSDWQYEGGNITGGFSYNYRGDLIIVIAESGVEGKKIPLKTFIIKDEDCIAPNETSTYVSKHKSYAIEEKIPLYDSWYNITSDGNLVCGVYTFFIRFKVDTDNYTKWFQITGDIIITQEVLGETYTHSYVYDGDIKKEWHPAFYVNSNGVSNKNINVFVDVSNIIGNEYITYDKFQVGYIIKRDNDVQGRIEGEYKINFDSYNEISVSDNNWQEVIAVEELVENLHPFFNVENVEVYNNRLYIGNYEENDVADYSNYAKNIRIFANAETILGNNANQALLEGYHYADVHLTVEQYLENFMLYGSYTKEHKILNIFKRNLQLDDNNLLLASENNSIIDELLNVLYLQVWVLDDYLRRYDADDVGKLYLNGKTYHNKDVVTSQVSGYWMIFNKQNPSDNICIYQTINNSNTLDLDNIDLDIDINLDIPSYRIGFDNDLGLFIRANDKNYYLFDSDNYCSFILGCEHHSFTQDSEAFDYLYLGNRKNEPLVDDELNAENVNAALLGAINKEGSDILIKVEITEASNPNTDSEGNVDIDGGVSFLGSNTRSLMSRQLYNFFIHYIRKDGSITPGYHIGSAKFLANNGIIVPSFSGIVKPALDIVGYFISYEEVERNVDCVYIISYTSNKSKITNALQLYNIENYYIKGTTIWIDDVKYVLDEDVIKYIENRLIENHIEVHHDLAQAIDEKVATFVRYIHNQYNKESKTLYRLTKNNYGFGDDIIISDRDYLPDFYQRQIIIYYDGDDLEGLIADPANTKVFRVNFGDIENEADAETDYHAYMIFPKMYSPYPTEAMNVKDDFIRMATLLEYGAENNTTKTEVINNFVSPDKLHDYLELKGAYISKPSKVYTNYNENNISRFDKTIYRSDVISDESLVNGFRRFAANNYKNILENKGKITNIVGIGFYLIVHTEYSMFVFDRTPKLTSQATLHIPDTFDTEYQEVMPSNEGFGGLRNKDEAILTKHGYIWYDYNNKYIFNYENGKSEIISTDINNFIKHLDIIDVRFAEDIIHSRLIICFHINKNGTDDYVTLSYNLVSKTYISFHDYVFTHNYRTYNTSYLINKGPNGTIKLYKYVDTHNANYTGLYRKNSFLAPVYELSNFRSKSYVDIIYNDAFVVSKSLESISYVLNKIVDEIGAINIADVLTRTQEDINTNKRYSGDNLLIYTDETQSGLLDINVDTPVNQFNEYKYPVYNKGVWQLNYFRNTINPRVESDNASLIYGKYIVVRFIFNNANRVKLETITFNTNSY